MPEALSVTAGHGWRGYAVLNAYARADTAISPAADYARKAASDIAARAENSKSLFGEKFTLIEQLHALKAECAKEDWDGNGAFALDPSAVATAEDLILALPDGFPLPECAPEPDGSISLDWIASRHRLFSLSVGRNDRLAYAWLDGTDKGHGVARLDGFSLPERILSEIRARVTHGEATVRVA
jgi:hypothetical protein